MMVMVTMMATMMMMVDTSQTLPSFMNLATAFCSLALSKATWTVVADLRQGKETARRLIQNRLKAQLVLILRKGESE